MESLKTGDLAKELSQLPTHGISDRVAEVLEVYQRVMAVYGPAAKKYEAALQAGKNNVGFSNSTNL